MNLFDRAASAEAPLADRMRPRSIDEVVGQRQLLASDKLLARAVRADRVPSMVLFGPPGTGKTTLARVIAHETKARFVPFSAVLGGVPELRKLLQTAKEERRRGQRTILFIDEIHRFNKAQQDALLPHVEEGTVVLVGATTENPSFAVNAALLSRSRVMRLESLDAGDLEVLLRRALHDEERGLGTMGLSASDEAIETLASGARGDARRALDGLEVAAQFVTAQDRTHIDRAAVEQALQDPHLRYDKDGEEHYNVVSAFIKSMRGNDPDAAIYWMMRMLEAGEDPLFVLRRMIIFASEDIGNADPRALQLAMSADQAFQRLGMPEGMFPLAQCCTYLASAPKSNASYEAWTAAQKDVRARGALEVPFKLRNAPTSAMKSWGYGSGYRYPHAEAGHAAGETYLPEALVGRRYYRPRRVGFEGRIRDRLERLRATHDGDEAASSERSGEPKRAESDGDDG
jgi:putative ATPase